MDLNILEEIKSAAQGNSADFLDLEQIQQPQGPAPETMTPTPDPAPNQQVLDGKISVASFLDTAQVTKGIDFALSGIFALAATKATKQRVSPEFFKMNAEERKAFASALHKALETVYLNFNNPWHVFGVVGFGIYVGKLSVFAGEIILDKTEASNKPTMEKKKDGRGRKPGSKNRPKDESNAGAGFDNLEGK